MFASLKEWMDVPLSLKRFKDRTGTGDKNFSETPDSVLCYPLSEFVTITSNTGAEITSKTQLYIDGDVEVSNLDVVIFEGSEHDIQHVSTFYRDGKPDIKVVYI